MFTRVLLVCCPFFHSWTSSSPPVPYPSGWLASASMDLCAHAPSRAGLHSGAQSPVAADSSPARRGPGLLPDHVVSGRTTLELSGPLLGEQGENKEHWMQKSWVFAIPPFKSPGPKSQLWQKHPHSQPIQASTHHVCQPVHHLCPSSCHYDLEEAKEGFSHTQHPASHAGLFTLYPGVWESVTCWLQPPLLLNSRECRLSNHSGVPFLTPQRSPQIPL